MSNRVVSQVYRSIIDDVVEKATIDFDEAGVQIEVLQELTRSWEAKVASSRVADFTGDHRMGTVAASFPMLPNPSPSPSTTTTPLPPPPPIASSSTTGEVKKEGDVKSEAANGNTIAAGTAVDSKPFISSETSTPQSKSKSTPAPDDDEINSDLDDSDDDDDDDEDDEDGMGRSGDLVIALYEKVQRTKNKWKVTLKDGLISVNGKDYLFAKCNGEFEF